MTLRMAATRARSRSIPSSWKEESSATTTSAGWPERTCSLSGVPRLPPTKVRRSSEKRAPASDVVVDLPLVPVMATSGVVAEEA